VTTILAIETIAGVQIGCDSQATGGDKIQLEQPKVFTNNGAIYGVAGTVLLANELRYADFPTPPEDPDDTDRWMTRELIPTLRAVLESAAIKPDDDGDHEMQLIIIANGRAYEIGGNTGWMRNTAGVYAVGSGGHFAAGAISAGASLEQALEIAAKHDPYTGYQLTSTTDRELLAG
jgi:ATP-dependent protease HslVU (ClpYQ) peptidase subunit